MTENKLDIEKRIADTIKEACDFEKEEREKDPVKLLRLRKFYKLFHLAASTALTPDEFSRVMRDVDFELLEEAPESNVSLKIDSTSFKQKSIEEDPNQAKLEL